MDRVKRGGVALERLDACKQFPRGLELDQLKTLSGNLDVSATTLSKLRINRCNLTVRGGGGGTLKNVEETKRPENVRSPC